MMTKKIIFAVLAAVLVSAVIFSTPNVLAAGTKVKIGNTSTTCTQAVAGDFPLVTCTTTISISSTDSKLKVKIGDTSTTCIQGVAGDFPIVTCTTTIIVS